MKEGVGGLEEDVVGLFRFHPLFLSCLFLLQPPFARPTTKAELFGGFNFSRRVITKVEQDLNFLGSSEKKQKTFKRYDLFFVLGFVFMFLRQE